MEKLKPYVVTKQSTDGSLEIGDIIWISNDGRLVSTKGCGLLENEEWTSINTSDFEVDEYVTYYIDVIEGKRETIRPINNII